MQDRRHRNQQQNRISPVIMMMLVEIYRQLERLEHKPPVTIALLAMNIYPYLYHVEIAGYSLSNVQQSCIHPRTVVSALMSKRGLSALPWHRLVLAGFMHGHDYHLYYNMLSLCWKGIHLERELGSMAFAQFVAYSLLTSHALLVAMSYFLYTTGHHEWASFDTCAIGFSAVLFSMKYVWNQLAPPSQVNIMGMFNVQSQYAAWAELLVVQVTTPNVSFLGHLAGILAGVFYAHVLPLVMVFLQGRLAANPSYTYARGRASASNQNFHYSRESRSGQNYQSQDRFGGAGPSPAGTGGPAKQGRSVFL